MVNSASLGSLLGCFPLLKISWRNSCWWQTISFVHNVYGYNWLVKCLRKKIFY